MADPTLLRESMRMEPVYTLGKLTGIRMHLTYRCGTAPVTTVATWDLPEVEQMYAEDFEANKPAIGPALVARAAEATNIEMLALRQIEAYLATLDT